MLTFQEIYEAVQSQTEDTGTDSLVVIKQAINQGMDKFGAILNREWRNVEATFSLVASQQFYQVPEDCIRVKSIVVTIGSRKYPLIEVPDEQSWNRINVSSATQTSNIPSHFYAKGKDRIGIYPVPSASVASAGTWSYEPRMNKMSVANYTTGTVTLTNASASVTGSGTTFTSAMVGRHLFPTTLDAHGGIGYKILTYTSATVITLENTYAGASVNASGVNFVIGEVPDIPSEYHESLIDYGCYRYYMRRRDYRSARDLKRAFQNDIDECMANYGSMTSSQYVRAIRGGGSLYSHHRIDYKVE